MPKIPKGKASEKVVHPYSRKAAYLAREEIRLKRKERQKTDKAARLSSIGEKLLWFQGQLDPEKTVYTKKDACDIIEREWTGDLKKLPNIKLRKVSRKGLDMNNEGEEKIEADEAQNKDGDDDLEDEVVPMVDSN
ncbi:Translation machinery-associated protein 16 [Channa argus]|uniref:Translation machinery-associated protein 16 n=1 Tax=Channa argus TaxID=215402 RepID=A0A6G1PCR2_CHAAH|nr:Translation machinery-associated protein 16 [Channa argus]